VAVVVVVVVVDWPHHWTANCKILKTAHQVN